MPTKTNTRMATGIQTLGSVVTGSVVTAVTGARHRPLWRLHTKQSTWLTKTMSQETKKKGSNFFLFFINLGFKFDKRMHRFKSLHSKGGVFASAR